MVALPTSGSLVWCKVVEVIVQLAELVDGMGACQVHGMLSEQPQAAGRIGGKIVRVVD